MRLPEPDAPLCSSGKRPFRTEDEARAELRRAQDVRSSDQHVGYRPQSVEEKCYQCQACGWWHLSSRSGRQRRSSLANRKQRRR